MDPDSMILLAVLVVMVAMSGYFSATETAFTSLNRIRLKSRADNGDKKAEKTLALAEEYDKLLSTILIGNNIVNITATTVSTVLCTRWFHQYGPTVATVALTIIILVFGEITPKSMSKERPEDFAMFAQPLLRLFMVVFTPLNFLFSQWKKLMSRVFRAKGDDGITEEELVGMVDQAQTEGGLDEHESDLIRNAIEFNDLEVSEILTPRVDLTAADEESSMEEIAALFAETGYSRIPIYHETVDNIVGVIHEKDFYAARYRGETMVSNLKAPVFYTTGNTKVFELLRILQKNKAHMAVVVDEYGGTQGICTLEDILEEAAGEPVLVAYRFQHERDRIMARFPQAVQLKDADTIAAWNRGEIPLMIAHPAGAGHGLNLQDGGHIIVWFGPTYDLELDEQFNDRLYRQGQKQTTSIIYLIAEGTVEADAMQALKVKANGQNAMMDAIKARIRKYTA